VIGLLINVALAAYLIIAKRLFGVRGGGKVDEDLRARDTSWQTIERATPTRSKPWRDAIDARSGSITLRPVGRW
jgi:hypothetical protein